MAETYIYKNGESERRWMGETSTDFLATGALTDGLFALVEEQAMHGESVPLHKHNDVESFYILEGEVLFYIGDQPKISAQAGAFIHIPGGTIHGFYIQSEKARYLILTTPRHGAFYRAISFPEPAAADDSIIEQACLQYGVELVGPLPTN